MRLINITLVVLCISISGCQTTTDRSDDLLPIYILTPEPSFTDKIALDSDDAALRYLAMRDMLTGDISHESHETDWDRWDQFIAIRNEDDIEDTALYSSFLKSHQWVFELADQTSRLEYFAQFNQFAGYYNGRPQDDDPRKQLLSTIRDLVITLADDSQRLWIEGNRDLAIKRLHTILRISKQIQLKPNAAGIDILVAIATANVALSRMDQILDTNQIRDNEMSLMFESLSVLEGHDPLGLYSERVRTIRSYQHWLETQLETENGTVELWALIGRFLGVPTLIQQIIDGPVGVPVTSNFVIEDPASPSNTMKKQILDQTLADLDDIDICKIRENYEEYQPLVDLALDELRSGSPRIEIFKNIKTLVEEDDTAVSDILGLPVLYSMIKSHQNMLDHRDDLLHRLHSN